MHEKLAIEITLADLIAIYRRKSAHLKETYTNPYLWETGLREILWAD